MCCRCWIAALRLRTRYSGRADCLRVPHTVPAPTERGAPRKTSGTEKRNESAAACLLAHPGGKKTRQHRVARAFASTPDSGNLDGILRLADMAIHYGASSGEVADLLKRASDDRMSLARQAAAMITKAQTVSYQEMRIKRSATGLKAEAEALATLAIQIAKQRSLQRAKNSESESCP